MVRPNRTARRARARGDTRGPDADPAWTIREDLGALADEHPRLERLAPALVGSPDPGVVLPGRPRQRVARRGRPGRMLGLWAPRDGAHPRPGHLRYVVQLRAVAMVHARVAGRDVGSRNLLPDLSHGDGVRHHLLLGRPDYDARVRADGDRAVPHRLPVGPHPRPDGPEDV